MIAFIVAGIFSLFMKNIFAFILYNTAFLYFYFLNNEENDEDEKEDLSFSDILLFPSLKEENIVDESEEDIKNINLNAIAVFVMITLLLYFAYENYLFLFFLPLLFVFLLKRFSSLNIYRYRK